MRIRSPRELGGFLRDARRKAGLSQTELANRLHTSQKWISTVENGKATAEMGMVLRVLEVLGVELSLRIATPEPQPADPAKTQPAMDDPGDLVKIYERALR